MGTYDSRSGFSHRGTNIEKHNAICAKCKKQCQVPFKPSGNRPVYCQDCYRNLNN